jgi:hypothetical protein
MNICSLVCTGWMAGLLGFASANAEAEVDAGKVPPALLRARAEAAHKTYDALAKNYVESRPPIGELLYRWSCRWLDAERELSDARNAQVAAYQAHLARMKDLERITKDRWRERYIPIEEMSAAQFYRAEAEIWLARATDRKAAATR